MLLNIFILWRNEIMSNETKLYIHLILLFLLNALNQNNKIDNLSHNLKPINIQAKTLLTEERKVFLPTFVSVINNRTSTQTSQLALPDHLRCLKLSSNTYPIQLKVVNSVLFNRTSPGSEHWVQGPGKSRSIPGFSKLRWRPYHSRKVLSEVNVLFPGNLKHWCYSDCYNI